MYKTEAGGRSLAVPLINRLGASGRILLPLKTTSRDTSVGHPFMTFSEIIIDRQQRSHTSKRLKHVGSRPLKPVVYRLVC